MRWQPGWLYVIGHLTHTPDSWTVTVDPGEWVILRPGHYIGPPIIDGYLVTGPAVFGADDPASSGRADAPGVDGIGPLLLTDTGPARWLLVDGYVYHVRDSADGRFHVRESPSEPDMDDSPFTPGL